MRTTALRELLPKRVYEAFLKAKPVDTDAMPSGRSCAHLRKHHGLSRELVAVVAGVSYGTLEDFERGRSQWSYALQRSETYRRLIAAWQSMSFGGVR